MCAEERRHLFSDWGVSESGWGVSGSAWETTTGTPGQGWLTQRTDVSLTSGGREVRGYSGSKSCSGEDCPPGFLTWWVVGCGEEEASCLVSLLRRTRTPSRGRYHRDPSTPQRPQLQTASHWGWGCGGQTSSPQQGAGGVGLSGPWASSKGRECCVSTGSMRERERGRWEDPGDTPTLCGSVWGSSREKGPPRAPLLCPSSPPARPGQHRPAVRTHAWPSFS